MKKIFIWLVIMVVVIVLAVLIFSGSNEPTEQNLEENIAPTSESRNLDQSVEKEQTETANDSNIINYTNSGYSPNQLIISLGDSVTFVNNSSRKMWTASAVHPTHTVYPGSGISNCGLVEGIFDSCEEIDINKEWSFTFNELGTWIYHNHLQSSHLGRVIVE